MDRWDYELNNCKPSEIGHSTHIKYYFKCLVGKHKSELKDISNFTNGQIGSMDCIGCNSFAEYLIKNYGENALDLYWDWNRNDILGVDPWKISKSANSPKVWIKCQNINYHIYDITCNNFTSGARCGYCNNIKIHPLDSLGNLFPEIFKIWSDKNNKTPYEYSPFSSKEVWWKCSDGKHEDYKRRINSSNDYNFRCPECSRELTESFLQRKVNLYLEKLGYSVLHENLCTLIPKNEVIPPSKRRIKKLRYDNEIIINNKHLIIEVHGSQHYQVGYFHKLEAKHYDTTPLQEFEYAQEKDLFKESFALLNGYEYLIIPYWTDDKDETWKLLLYKKLETLLNERR